MCYYLSWDKSLLCQKAELVTEAAITKSVLELCAIDLFCQNEKLLYLASNVICWTPCQWHSNTFTNVPCQVIVVCVVQQVKCSACFTNRMFQPRRRLPGKRVISLIYLFFCFERRRSPYPLGLVAAANQLPCHRAITDSKTARQPICRKRACRDKTFFWVYTIAGRSL